MMKIFPDGRHYDGLLRLDTQRCHCLVIAVLCMILLKVWQTKDYKRLFIFAAIAILPFVSWLLYVNLKFNCRRQAV